MLEFFAFRKMICTTVIKVLYIMGMIAVTAGGLALIFAGRQNAYIIYGLLTIFFGNLFWRLLCEYSILLFSMHELLAGIAAELKSQNIEVQKGGFLAEDAKKGENM